MLMINYGYFNIIRFAILHALLIISPIQSDFIPIPKHYKKLIKTLQCQSTPRIVDFVWKIQNS